MEGWGWRGGWGCASGDRDEGLEGEWWSVREWESPGGEMRVNEVVKMGVVQEVAEVANLRIGKKVIMFDNRKLCDLMVFSITSSRAYQYSPIAGPQIIWYFKASAPIKQHTLHRIPTPYFHPPSLPPPRPTLQYLPPHTHTTFPAIPPHQEMHTSG